MIFLIIASAYFLFQASILSLLVASLLTVINFFAAKLIERINRKIAGNAIFIAAIVLNIVNLFFFKEINLFFRNPGSNTHMTELGKLFQLNHFIIPIGLSFYTFSIIGYLVDVRIKSIKAEKNFVSFLSFVFFFPKILAGPIERIQHFIPQTHEKKSIRWENFSAGGKLIIWGTFQKLVVADRISIFVDRIYSNIQMQAGITIFVCILLYTFQIYSDFSGYTNIARGIARILGYDLLENFNRPLFAGTISEFWRRWHISLSSWVNNYIYIPLSLKFRNIGSYGIIISLLISFLIIGIWHGFLLTFVLFGIIQGILITFEFLIFKWKNKTIRHFPVKIVHFTGVFFTFLIMSFTLVLFRAPDLSVVHELFSRIGNPGNLIVGSPAIIIYILIGITILLSRDISIEFFKKDILKIRSRYFIVRALPYMLIVIMILLFGVFDGGQFIYLQF